jgi:hypothetical protein
MMARSRNIKPAFFDNENLAALTPHARLLFIGLWCLADVKGRLEDRPSRIRARIFPYEPHIDIESLLNELASPPEFFIVRYQVEQSRYIEITNFRKHQNPSTKEKQAGSSIPPRPVTNAPKGHDRDAPGTLPGHDRDAPGTLPGHNWDAPGTFPEHNQNVTGTHPAQLITDIPITDSLTLKPEADAKASDVCVSDEDRQFAQEGMDYLLSLNSPNHCNVAWVKGYLSIQFQELEQSRPDLAKPDILNCWRDTCDLAVSKNVISPKWFKTTFTNKLNAWTSKTVKTHASEQASKEAQALLSFPFIQHRLTGEVFQVESLEIRPDSPNGLTDKRGMYYPASQLEGLTEVPTHEH